ncbi:MAG TPA: DUF929 family protein, partial [Acidimicrobiales bacterium]|nr:DUF929 family protein [Acidimicrobiales bacterium]
MPTNNPKNPQQPTKKSASSKRFNERQEAKRRAAQAARRQKNRTFAIGTIVLVVVIVGTLVLIKVTGGGSPSNTSTNSPPDGTPIAAATLHRLASIPVSTLDAAPSSVILTQLQHVSGSTMTVDGKPEVFYVGAEFCPYCGAERWAMYIALSKFGTFSP